MSERDNGQVFRAGGRSLTAPAGTLRRFVPFKLGTPVVVPMWIDVSSGINGSVQILTQNDLRASLTIQNLSATATLYFAWGSDASPTSGLSLAPGRGVIYDVICPQSALKLYMNSVAGTPQQCQVMEISYE